MRKLRLFIIVASLFAAVGAVPARAQQPLPGVAVVDIQLVLRDSAASKSIQGQIEKQRAAYQAEITKQENELRAAEQELTRQRSIISAEAFAERRRAFEQRVANLQRDVQNRKRALDKSLSTARRTIENAVQDVVGQLVQERKYTLIIFKHQTMYNAPEMEVTQEVLKRLNAKLPSVKVPPPEK